MPGHPEHAMTTRRDPAPSPESVGTFEAGAASGSANALPALWRTIMTLGDGGRVEFLVRQGVEPLRADAGPSDTPSYRLCHPDGSTETFMTMRHVAEHLRRRRESKQSPHGPAL